MMIISLQEKFLKVQPSQKMQVISLFCFHAKEIVKMYFLVYHIVFVYVDENDRLKGTIHILEDKLKTSEEVCHKLSFFR